MAVNDDGADPVASALALARSEVGDARAVARRVLASVRRARRPGRRVRAHAPGGPVWVSDAVIRRVLGARLTAAGVSPVSVDPQLDGDRLVGVRVRIGVQFGARIAGVVAGIRTEVRSGLVGVVGNLGPGLEVPVEVQVVDVLTAVDLGRAPARPTG